MDIEKLLEISKALKKEDTYNDLMLIKNRLEQPNKDIVIPLVGEFSSGKTSLINALTDTKKLETASKATTATIFEVRFGNEKAYAKVVKNGEEYEVENIEELKNDTLGDTELVRVYDTSQKVPNSTILVDTPGLSSNDPRHQLALTSYLPFSDAIFLVIDINQQITRSLLDFVETTKLSEKPIYLIITKSDTKTADELVEVKKYIAKNIKLPIDHIVSTSASKDNLDELYGLFDDIQKEKNKIVEKALENRLKEIAGYLASYIDELLSNLSSTSTLDEKIEEENNKLEKIKRNIDRLIRDASEQLEEKQEECERRFTKIISERLDTIVKNSGADCDNEVYSTVNTVAGTIANNYKKEVQHTLLHLARERQARVEAVPLQVLESLDLSSIAFREFSYDMNLSTIGHENDEKIGGIVKGVGGLVAIAGLAKIGGIKGLISAADSFFDIGSMISNKKNREEMKELKKELNSVSRKEKLGEVEKIIDEKEERKGKETAKKLLEKSKEFRRNMEDAKGEIEGYNKLGGGIIETGVSWITEKVWGKPQRRRAVREYIEGTLLPEFKGQMDNTHSNLTNMISLLLKEEANKATAQMKETLNEMEEEKKKEKEVYKQKVNQLKEYKEALN
ncbi:dynamin family protein [Weeksellaceae bacterium TAE3-ERU29]|nr:dynamin family protein [Weeksellaceae bacterium TAE3-ERU29]